MLVDSRRFTIIYAPITKQHLRTIETKYYSLIRNTISEQLSFEPTTETRNRKPLKRPAFVAATWEIRFGSQNRFRVFYDVALDEMMVSVLAIGVKQGSNLIIGGKEIDL